MTTINDLVGKTFTNVHTDADCEIMVFEGTEGNFRFFHQEDCCERVSIEDVCGDLQDLVGVPILSAQENSNQSDTDDGDEQWTFYIFRTIRGTVIVRWYGSSNGYYSTSVSLERY